jgi:hypothetical protein
MERGRFTRRMSKSIQSTNKWYYVHNQYWPTLQITLPYSPIVDAVTGNEKK